MTDLSEKEKDKRHIYTREKYQNVAEEQKLKRCQYYQECK